MADAPSADRSRQPLQLVSVEGRERLHMPLPAPLTSLVGREHEVLAVAGLARSPDVRLVTLTGPGGVGKTRLTLRLADELADDFPAGIAFVPLASISEPGVVPSTIAQALGVRETGGRPLSEILTTFLRERRLLLILDNFEQVVDAAPLVTALLTACPDLKALVTSRIALRVQGEHEFPVPPLALPDAGHFPPLADLARTEAVELFVHRVRAARPDFVLTAGNAPTIAEICRRLDGLPLAIELAAARSKVLSPAALAARLTHRLQVLTSGPQDQPARLQTMRAAIAWSYDLLTADEQAHFRRFAVFAGGFTLDAAEQLMAAGSTDPPSPIPHDPSPPDVLDVLASLVDKSLLWRMEDGAGDLRFTMLETIREYGLEQLAAEGEEAEARRRHAAWCVALAEELAPALESRQNAAQALGRLAAEHDNVRAALTYFDSAGDGESLLRLAGALFLFWYVRGHLREGRLWLARALMRGDDAPAAARARALVGAGMLAHYLADDANAVPWLEASLALNQQTADHRAVAFSLVVLGVVAEDAGDYERATAHFSESLSHARAANDPIGTGLALFHLGVVAWGQGDRVRAAELMHEALAVQRAAGDLAYGAAESLSFLGQLASELGDFSHAVVLQRESLSLHREVGSPEVVAGNLANVAVLAAADRRPELAARLFGAATGQREAIDNPFKLPERALYDRSIDAVRSAMRAEEFTAAWNAGHALSLADATTAALAALDEIGSQIGSTSSPDRSAVPADGGLTAREVEVLCLLAEGRTDREIADALFISPRTAQGHVAHIFTKLNVNTRIAAVAAARKAGIIPTDPATR